MRRMIILAAMLLMVAAPAHAQLTIRKTSDKPKQEAVLAAQWNWLYTQEGTWYLTINSDNRFDELTWITLGEDGESALISLQQLIDLTEELGDDERVNIDDRYGKVVMLSLYIVGGKRIGFKVFADGKAGMGYLTTAALKKGIQHIRGKMSMDALQRQKAAQQKTEPE